jgi:hypothetical protein
MQVPCRPGTAGGGEEPARTDAGAV